MATGTSNQLARQIGEHLVAAELGRRGYIAAPFAGNVPLFDLLAANERGVSVPIQVKAIREKNEDRGCSWQFKINSFFNVEVDGITQHNRGRVHIPNIIHVFVVVADTYGKDRFYVFRREALVKFFEENYFVSGASRIRPKNPESMHCAIWLKDLECYIDRWDVISEALNETNITTV